jgi:hypothetical protein
MSALVACVNRDHPSQLERESLTVLTDQTAPTWQSDRHTIWLTTTIDRAGHTDHAVRHDELATHSGRCATVRGTTIYPTSMMTPPGPPCGRCVTYRETTPPQPQPTQHHATPPQAPPVSANPSPGDLPLAPQRQRERRGLTRASPQVAAARAAGRRRATRVLGAPSTERASCSTWSAPVDIVWHGRATPGTGQAILKADHSSPGRSTAPCVVAQPGGPGGGTRRYGRRATSAMVM